MLKRLILPLLLACLITGCATDNKTRYLGNTAEYIYALGHNDLADGDYNDAIQAFESLSSQYPFSEFSKKGDLEIIYAYYLADQPAMALASAERYLKLYPDSVHADYAYYMIGVADFDNGRGFLQRYFPYEMGKHKAENYMNAYHNFEIVVKHYPKSAYAEDARRRMMYLVNTMANYQYLVGDYYYQRKAYVAALARAKNVILHYPRSPYTEKALELSIKSYEALGMYDLATSTYDVLKLNYPSNNLSLAKPATSSTPPAALTPVKPQKATSPDAKQG